MNWLPLVSRNPHTVELIFLSVPSSQQGQYGGNLQDILGTIVINRSDSVTFSGEKALYHAYPEQNNLV
jgi:hypothetical protein